MCVPVSQVTTANDNSAFCHGIVIQGDGFGTAELDSIMHTRFYYIV